LRLLHFGTSGPQSLLASETRICEYFRNRLAHKPQQQFLTTFEIQSPSGKKIEVTAVIVLKVTCDLPTAPIAFVQTWSHLNDITLTDPGFGQPGRIDVLLGADIFVDGYTVATQGCLQCLHLLMLQATTPLLRVLTTL